MHGESNVEVAAHAAKMVVMPVGDYDLGDALGPGGLHRVSEVGNIYPRVLVRPPSARRRRARAGEVGGGAVPMHISVRHTRKEAGCPR